MGCHLKLSEIMLMSCSIASVHRSKTHNDKIHLFQSSKLSTAFDERSVPVINDSSQERNAIKNCKRKLVLSITLKAREFRVVGDCILPAYARFGHNGEDFVTISGETFFSVLIRRSLLQSSATCERSKERRR